MVRILLRAERGGVRKHGVVYSDGRIVWCKDAEAASKLAAKENKK